MPVTVSLYHCTSHILGCLVVNHDGCPPAIPSVGNTRDCKDKKEHNAGLTIAPWHHGASAPDGWIESTGHERYFNIASKYETRTCQCYIAKMHHPTTTAYFSATSYISAVPKSGRLLTHHSVPQRREMQQTPDETSPVFCLLFTCKKRRLGRCGQSRKK